jgi:hypothetical protein
MEYGHSTHVTNVTSRDWISYLNLFTAVMPLTHIYANIVHTIETFSHDPNKMFIFGREMKSAN